MAYLVDTGVLLRLVNEEDAQHVVVRRAMEQLAARGERIVTTIQNVAEFCSVAAVEVSEDTLSVSLVDGRTILVPLAWYPRLMNATPEQRQHWQIAGGGYGLHWPEIDEDLSTEGLLRGAPALRVA